MASAPTYGTNPINPVYAASGAPNFFTLGSSTYQFFGIQTAVKLDYTTSNYIADSAVNQGGIQFAFDRSGSTAKFGISLPGIATDELANFLAAERLGSNTSQSGRRTYGDIYLGDSRPSYFTWKQYTSSTPDPDVPTQFSDLAYTYLGTWAESAGGTIIDRIGIYLAGFQTPLSGMPISGTATFGGTGTVHGLMFAGPVASRNIVGDSSLTANFATGTLTGTFTNMTVADNNGDPQAWNAINISARIAGNGFTGTTSSLAHSGSFSFGASSGDINGGFYGPAAREIGAVWTLSDGTNSAMGAVGAKRTPGP